VIGTPGRLQHTLLKSPEFNAKKLELLILDEADRLLDMGFQHSLNRYCQQLFAWPSNTPSIGQYRLPTYANLCVSSRMLTYADVWVVGG